MIRYGITALAIIFASTACMNKGTEEATLDQPVTYSQQECLDAALSSDIFLSELCRPEESPKLEDFTVPMHSSNEN